MSASDIDRFRGTRLRGSDGTELGTVQEIYTDDKTGWPEWARVRLDGGSERLVPITTADKTGDHLQVVYSREKVAGSPAPTVERHITAAQEARLRKHYGIGTVISTMTSGSSSTTAGPDPAGSP
jgi:hypothetical protein